MGKIDISEISKSVRTQDVNGTIKLLRRNINVYFSWGVQALTNYNNRILRFKVNARRHTGHIYITVNASDLYNVCLTTTRGTIVKEMNDIYFEDLVQIIDTEIEYVKNYSF